MSTSTKSELAERCIDLKAVSVVMIHGTISVRPCTAKIRLP
ncbi:hypothetical protein [Mycolicibacterium sp. P9-22]|nr:hypothetical protein [Mycolicibacterium sp. P9-22]